MSLDRIIKNINSLIDSKKKCERDFMLAKKLEYAHESRK